MKHVSAGYRKDEMMAEIDDLKELVKSQQDELISLRDIAVELMDALKNYETDHEAVAKLEKHMGLD